jgi:hypothetical protein
VGLRQPFYSPKRHSKNAWWVSTSLFIRKIIIIKMTGGYPPAFLFGKSHSEKAWWVSTRLFFNPQKSF